jgi:hypothetical protein
LLIDLTTGEWLKTRKKSRSHRAAFNETKCLAEVELWNASIL